MSDLSNPHDRFFRESMARVELARDFMTHYLPAAVVPLLDLSTLELSKDSFIDDDLREHLSDLLYRVQLAGGDEACIYVLFDHKSYPEGLISLQLLRYMLRIWELAVKQQQPLRPILPVVVYHGTSAWKVGLRLHNLLHVPPELAPHVPDFEYCLCDISHLEDDEIRGEVALQLWLQLLKYIRTDEIGERLPGLLRLIQKLENSNSRVDYLMIMLSYLMSGTDRVTMAEVRQALQASAEGDTLMNTIAEQLMKEGEQRGEQRGLLSGIETGLEAKFGRESLDLMNEIRPLTDAGLLRDIQRHLWTATTPEDVRKVYRNRQ